MFSWWKRHDKADGTDEEGMWWEYEDYEADGEQEQRYGFRD